MMEGNGGPSNLRVDDEAILNMTKDDVMSMHFVTLLDAEQFYRVYACVHGFGIRMDTLLKNKHGQPTARWMAYSAQGSRDLKYIEQLEQKYKHRALTWFGCKAGLRVKLMKETNRWHVYWFDDDRSHDILRAKYTSLYKCHRMLFDGDKAQVETMHAYGFTDSSIYEYITG